ncbi:MAG: PAS domain-containing sensor histidine kinase [Desulfobacter sp.]|nr:PAS domain-containing sensor histidine kinase [Desulfobacter sp.]WDP87828.1 MAG: PAS domain-containing sensor histidine kinase [Desulfobacter sp.]
MAKQVLLIDRDQDHAQAVTMYIRRKHYDAVISTSNEQTMLFLDNHDLDIVIAHAFVTPETGQYLLAYKAANPLVQIIVTAQGEDLDEAMDLYGLHALDYLDLPINSRALDLALARADAQTALLTRMDLYTGRLEDLHHARNLFNQLFEEVPCYISVQDRNLRITAANRRFKRDFGSLVGGFCYEVYKHRSSPCRQCPVVATFKDGKSHTTEEIVTSKEGKQYNVLTQTAAIRNGEGKIAQVMEMSTNITQIRQLQDHLVSLGLMLGSMSHGVKGMLTALDGGIYQLEAGLDQQDEKRMTLAFGQIKHMADKIKKMVLEILYYAKSRELQYETKDIAKMTANVVATLTPLTRKHKIHFMVSIAHDLGTIEVDPQWMEAALVNFLENAVDACLFDRNRKTHEVSFIVEKKSRTDICFTIQDNGIGMDAETKNKMFTLFFTSKGSQGTGLGLFIAHRVIKYHGGTVEVDSHPGKGSRFIICFPFQKPENAKMMAYPGKDKG